MNDVLDFLPSARALPPRQAASVSRDVSVSFEFFPPRTEAMARTLWASIERLAPLDPAFVSVTYGADGSTRERTHGTVSRLRRETSLEVAAHLTCVGAARLEVDDIARLYWDEGVRHLVALRGDPPDGNGRYVPHADGYGYAADLVAGLKRVADFEITVAAHPEVHPEAPYPQFDLDNLKRKVDAGATRAITQYFFDTDIYLRFLERASAAGIGVPIVPGILPVTNFAQVVRFSRECCATVPRWMADLFDGLDDDPETRRLVAATVAAEQVRILHHAGTNAFHFFTLNRADLTFAICHILGVRPPDQDQDGD